MKLKLVDRPNAAPGTSNKIKLNPNVTTSFVLATLSKVLMHVRNLKATSLKDAETAYSEELGNILPQAMFEPIVMNEDVIRKRLAGYRRVADTFDVDSGSCNVIVVFIVSPIVSFGGGTVIREFPDNVNVKVGVSIVIAAQAKLTAKGGQYRTPR